MPTGDDRCHRRINGDRGGHRRRTGRLLGKAAHRAGDLTAPHGMHAEVTSVLRREELSGHLSSDVAALARSDLNDLFVDMYPYGPFGERVWQLRRTVNAYDAWYVALAEAVNAPLATLDRKLVGAPGPTCDFETP